MEKINDMGNSEPSQATKKMHSTETKERPEREARDDLARKARATALKQDDEWRAAKGLPPRERTRGRRSVCPTGRGGRGAVFNAGPSYRDNGPFEATGSADLLHLHLPSRSLERDNLEQMSDFTEHALFHFVRTNAPEVLESTSWTSPGQGSIEDWCDVFPKHGMDPNLFSWPPTIHNQQEITNLFDRLCDSRDENAYQAYLTIGRIRQICDDVLILMIALRDHLRTQKMRKIKECLASLDFEELRKILDTPLLSFE